MDISKFLKRLEEMNSNGVQRGCPKIPNYKENDKHFSTVAIHAGQDPDQWKCKAVVPLISLSTTFKQAAPGEFEQFEYARSGNPTRQVLETCIAALDKAKHAITFSSGLAAITTMTSTLNAGDNIIAMNDLYGGTNRYFRQVASRMNIDTTFVDARVPENVGAALKSNTKMVWIESPTNPTMKIVDIQAVCEIVKKKDPSIMVVVDNTFESAYFMRPLELGADVTMYSLTKYMNGHTDVIMGSLSTNDSALAEKLIFLQNAIGSTPSPFDCYLVNRSLKTLKVRMEAHQINSLVVANYLESHPMVEKVLHPRLTSHPQHELVKKQQYGHSGIMSFYLKGDLNQSRKFLSSLKMFILAESLGGFDSLAELPFEMTHSSIKESERIELGVTDNLIRLSIGLEDPEDLIMDLQQAIQIACGNPQKS